MPCATKELQNKYMREHYKNIVGLRVKECVWLYTDKMTKVLIQPDDFLFSKSRLRPMNIFGNDVLKVHVPRSLCKRARITLNKTTGKIVATSKMYSKNKSK